MVALGWAGGAHRLSGSTRLALSHRVPPKAASGLCRSEEVVRGCCSCETIAPGVFEINKQTRSNPKSSVINQKGAGINKIMNAAQTCPTKAIRVDNIDTKERIFPY